MAAEKTNKTKKRELETYRPMGWLSPFERMDEMFDEFIRRPLGRPLLNRFPRIMEEIAPSPSVDIFEEKDDVVLKTELPGMTKDDIEINLTDNMITLSGVKKHEEKIEEKNYYRCERSYGSFKRSFNLPAEVQSDKAKASFKNGVLEVRIPKTEEARKKAVKIKIEE
jgi:HSP20 family protein